MGNKKNLFLQNIFLFLFLILSSRCLFAQEVNEKCISGPYYDATNSQYSDVYASPIPNDGVREIIIPGEGRWEIDYKQGLPDGIARFYSQQDNNLIIEESFVGGKRNGLRTVYNSNGAVVCQKSFKNDLLLDKDGKLKFGMDIEYYANGNKAFVRMYVRGQWVGHFEYYREDGTLQAQDFSNEDLLEGVRNIYYPNGQLKEMGVKGTKYDKSHEIPGYLFGRFVDSKGNPRSFQKIFLLRGEKQGVSFSSFYIRTSEWGSDKEGNFKIEVPNINEDYHLEVIDPVSNSPWFVYPITLLAEQSPVEVKLLRTGTLIVHLNNSEFRKLTSKGTLQYVSVWWDLNSDGGQGVDEAENPRFVDDHVWEFNDLPQGQYAIKAHIATGEETEERIVLAENVQVEPNRINIWPDSQENNKKKDLDSVSER